MKTVIANFEAFIHRDEESRGLLTGYSEIDKMSNGLKPGEMFIIAARPSMGKTSLAMNLIEHFCLDLQLPALMFSLEMGAFQLVERLLYARARFDKSKVMRGFEPVKSDFVNIKRASEEIKDCKLIIDDTPGISINELRAKARRKKKEEDIRGLPPPPLEPTLDSGPRLSWARTMMGILSSLAKPLRPAEISATSRSREFCACLELERMS